MSERNPYAAPVTVVADPTPLAAGDIQRHRSIAGGQRMAILSILVAIVAGALSRSVDPFAPLLVLAATLLGVAGVVRAAHGLWRRVLVTILLGVLSFMPALNLLVMLVVSNRATRHLRAAGYRVGFAGASVPRPTRR